ncbi:MAG TPA: hypothetical protein VJH03_18475 [Blastocatellia bacterium]|nr:hypothetical protein [Blastocatellia bacterium]
MGKAGVGDGDLEVNQRGLPLRLPEKVTMVWLLHNVPVTVWLWFAGIVIGALVLGGAVGQTTFVKELLNKKPEATIQPPQISSHETTGSQKDAVTKNDEPNTGPLRMSEPTPQQINEAIDKAPPLQQGDIKRRYEGVKVDWELMFDHASSIGKDNVVVLFRDSESFSMLSVRCVVKLPLYRDLAIMNRGKRIRVVGTIHDVDFPFITLEDVQLTY